MTNEIEILIKDINTMFNNSDLIGIQDLKEIFTKVVSFRKLKLKENFDQVIEQININATNKIQMIKSNADNLIKEIIDEKESSLYFHHLHAEEMNLARLESNGDNLLTNEKLYNKFIFDLTKSKVHLNELFSNILNSTKAVEFVPDSNQNSIGILNFKQKVSNDYKQVADYLYKNDDLEQAEFYYDIVLSGEVDFYKIAELYSIKSKIYKRLKREVQSDDCSKKAIEQYNKIIEKNNNDHLALFLKSELLIKLGQYSNASKVLDTAIELAPTIKKYKNVKNMLPEVVNNSIKIKTEQVEVSETAAANHHWIYTSENKKKRKLN